MLAGILLILLGMSALTLFLLKFFLWRTRLHLPSIRASWSGEIFIALEISSSALLAALGLGVMCRS